MRWPDHLHEGAKPTGLWELAFLGTPRTYNAQAHSTVTNEIHLIKAVLRSKALQAEIPAGTPEWSPPPTGPQKRHG